MKLHELKPAAGSVKKRIRLGRGEASGKGGTSTKGNKGQQSRTGYQKKLGHEGGQMPLQRRIPKRGFKNPFRIDYKVFNLPQLNELVDKYKLTEFSKEQLHLKKLISQTDKVKILGDGECTISVPIRVDKISAKAQEKLKKLNIEITIISSIEKK